MQFNRKRCHDVSFEIISFIVIVSYNSVQTNLIMRYVFVCVAETVKSIKLCRKMFLLLSKDDRCRLYLLRLLVEGTLQKVTTLNEKILGYKKGRP